MIELSPLARPYAKAIFLTALEQDEQEKIASDLALLSTVSLTKEVSSLIEDPEFSKQEIARTINKLMGKDVGEILKKMVELHATNKRLNLIEAIYISYKELLEQHNKTSSIIVNIATKPSNENKQMIIDKLFARYGKGSNIEFSEDPSIMGGFSIKIGDEIFDLSIRGKVKKLVNQLNF